jgi:hypothetical protein
MLLVIPGIGRSIGDSSIISSEYNLDSDSENVLGTIPLSIDSSSDEDWLLPLLAVIDNEAIKQRGPRGAYRRPKSQHWYENTVQHYNDMEFRKTFRLNKSTFDNLIKDIEGDAVFCNNSRCKQKPVKLQLAVFLKTLGSVSSRWDVSTHFGISQGTVCLYCDRVSKAIKNLRDRVVVWPQNADRSAIISGFQEMAGFPGVVGAIDGTHINLWCAPTAKDKDVYFSRHHRYAIHLQAICDHRGLFISYDIGWPGSVHDAKVYRNSRFFCLEAKTLTYNQHIIADSAYPISVFCMPAFRDSTNIPGQKKYNCRHVKTRVVVEQLFGRLKNRFQLLRALRVKDIGIGVDYIECACILHNYLEGAGDIWTIDDVSRADDDYQEDVEEQANVNERRNFTHNDDDRDEERRLGNMKRANLVNLFIRQDEIEIAC